ncbi:MAG: hypothetical protein QF577_06020 [Phycisphaerae bacterium]|jgi:DhnA family fructose-bisphosphate aldolase class Ia|nr:hypothetical protein [Phycisphaerae bacterium]
MSIGKAIRLAKFFASGKNTVIAAMDHGMAIGAMPGLENPAETARRMKAADGIMMCPATLEHCRDVFTGPDAPYWVCRTTWTTGYCASWRYVESWTTMGLSPREALFRGADMLVASCNIGNGDEAADRDSVTVFSEIAAEKEECGIPLIGEYMPIPLIDMTPPLSDLSPDDLHRQICVGVRILAELGADCIKTYYTGERFSEVIEVSPVPVLVLGSSKMKTSKDALELASKSIRAGARGVVFGRNVFQAERPSEFLGALKAVVHNGASADEAAAEHGLV